MSTIPIRGVGFILGGRDVAQARVRAHARRGTRGVRSHLRFAVGKTYPTTIRIAKRGGELRYFMDRYNGEDYMARVRAFYRPDRGTIYLNELRSVDPRDQPTDTAGTVSHEELHRVLDSLGEREASAKLDRLPRYSYGPYLDVPEMSGLHTSPKQLRQGGIVDARRREII